MSVRITPSVINAELTASTASAHIAVRDKKSIVNIPAIKQKISTYSAVSHNIYQPLSPTYISVIAKAVKRIPSLKNDAVRQQTIKLLLDINSSLLAIAGDAIIDNRLPSIALVERDDQSVLLEWSFESFRYGFAIEIQKEESNFYLISEDKESGSFDATIRRLESNYDEIIKSVADYVIRNT